MVIVNAENLVVGRVASFAAKKALQGEEVVIVNAEKAVVTGSRSAIVSRFKKRFDLSPKGNPEKGPKYSRMPDRMLRRAVRGMLPWKRATGKKAFKRIKVFIGVPSEFEKEKIETVAGAENKARKGFVELGELSNALGAKW